MIINKFKMTQKNNEGFTIVELIVVSLLIVIVFFFVMNFMLTSGNFFKLNTDKADAQSQARLIFQGLTKELSTAKYVEIVDTGDTNTLGVPSDKIGFKVEENMLVEIDGGTGDKSPAFNNMALDSLVIDFIRDPSNIKLMQVVMNANDGTIFETQIYIPNVTQIAITASSGAIQGRGLLIKP